MAKKNSSKKSSSKKSSSKKTTKTSVSKTVTSYVKSAVKEPTQPAAYVPSVNNVEYTPVQNDVGEFVPGQFTSKYQPQIDEALNKVTNWSYDPLQDANYQALAKVYEARGNTAAKNSLADAAALNGGYGTSYAVSAAQQARNQYNQELAALVPDLEQTAYQRATGTLGALRDADDTDYARFRDTEGDRQWKYGMDYQNWRDRVADSQWDYDRRYGAWRDSESDRQWAYNANYQRYQDALSHYQWSKDYNLGLYQYKQQTSSSSGSGGGGGGGRRRGGGGGGYSGGGSASSNSSYATLDKRIDMADPNNKTYHPNSVIYYKNSGGSTVKSKSNPAQDKSGVTYDTYNLRKKKK